MKFRLFTIALLFTGSILYGQVNVDVNLNIKHSVDGVSDFGRERHIISHTGATDPDWSGHEDMMDYFFNDLDVYLGRDNGSAGWKAKMTTEDPNKPNWPDANSIKTVADGLKNWYEGKDHIDRHQYEARSGSLIMGMNPYPIYPSLDWTNAPTDGSYNTTGKMDSGWQTHDVDAAAYFTAQYLDKHYAKTPDETGEPLPKYWECMNEPDMAIAKHFIMFLSSPEKLFEFHNLSAQEIRNTLGEHAPKIGGFTWGQHDFWASDWVNRHPDVTSYYDYSSAAMATVYDNMWLDSNGTDKRNVGSPIWEKKSQDWWQWDGLFQEFMERCGENMDFYSVHIYDWPNVTDAGEDWSTYRTGGHAEAMLDMIEWYDINRFTDRKDIIISEYGTVNGTYLDKLGYKRRDWENLRPFNQMFMQFLERPSHLVLTMPFAPIKATWGDYWNADGSLLQRYEVTMMDPIGNYTAPGTADSWEWSDIILWYELWSDVKGTRIDTKADNPDIQVDAYVDGKHVYLIINNLVGVETDINLHMFDDYMNNAKSVKVTHQYLNETLNRAVNDVKTMSAIPGQITLGEDATMILDIEFENNVTIDQESKEYKYMSDWFTTDKNTFGRQKCYVRNGVGEEFTTNVNGVTVPSIGEAKVRVGMKVWNGVELNIVINGTTVNVGDHTTSELNVRGRQQSRGGHGYWGVIEVDIPLSVLKADNEIKLTCPHSDYDLSSVQLQVWDFTKAPKRSADGDKITATGITTESAITLMENMTEELSVTFAPVNASNKAVTWSSSNESVATVNEFGVVTAVAASGTANIVAKSTDGGFESTTIVTAAAYVPTSVTGVEIQEGTSITVPYYTNTPLTAVVSPFDASVQTVQWSSDNEDVYVSAAGKVTGKNIGAVATVTAKVIDIESGNAVFTDDIEVTVTIMGEESVYSRALPDTVRPYASSNFEVDVVTGGARKVTVKIIDGATVIGSGEYDFYCIGDTTVNVPYTLIGTPVINKYYDVELILFDGATEIDMVSDSVYMADHYRATSVEIIDGARDVQTTKTLTLEANILPVNTFNKDVTWSSSNAGIASVGAATGIVTGVSVGTAIITVTSDDGSFTDTAHINVQTDAVVYEMTDVKLPESLIIFPEGEEQLSYTFSPAWATETNVVWSASNNLVSVDQTGKVIAGTESGLVEVIATSVNNTLIADTCYITVGGIIVVQAEDFISTGGTNDGFEIWESNGAGIINWNQSGDWGDYSVTFPEDGNFNLRYYIGAPDANADIGVNLYVDGVLVQTTTFSPTGDWDTYKAFNSVGSVYVTEGTHTIRIESTGTSDWQWNSDRFEFRKADAPDIPVTSLSLNKTTATIAKGSTLNLTPAISPSSASEQGIVWVTDNPAVATVLNGVVTAVSIGDAKITATAVDHTNGVISATCTVTVEKGGVETPVTAISINKVSNTILVGETFNLIPSLTPTNATIQNVEWSSDNSGIAKVTNGTVEGISVGTAKITVTSLDNTNGIISATCTVHVGLSGIKSNNYGNVTVYPNPTDGIINISGLTETASVDIYNLQGFKIGHIDNVNEDNSISLNEFSSGVYILKITSNSVSHIIKVNKN